MSWRNQVNHNEETKAVKAALTNAGIKAKVGHGTGTAWAWLEIRVDSAIYSEFTRLKATKIAKEVTGRTGDYNGEILVMNANGTL